MSRNTLQLTDQVYDYLLKSSLQEHECQQMLRAETSTHTWATMQISPEQGQFMQILVKLLDAKNIIELGVFTGYSSLTMALALPDDGRLIACDVSEEYTRTAREYWQKAGVSKKIDLRLAPALETLENLLNTEPAASFDLVFLDAVKEEYLRYYEYALKLLRQGGLVVVDNVLWDGKTANPEITDTETVALREFNRFVHADCRVDMCMLPIGDGLTLARKR